MPSRERHKTSYPGVVWVPSTAPGTTRPDKTYRIIYRKVGDRRIIEENAGQASCGMTPARAAHIRAERMQGKALSNEERRQEALARKEAERGRYTFDRLWEEYQASHAGNKSLSKDGNRYVNHIGPALGDKAPADLVPLDIDRLRIKLGKDHKPATVRNVLELVRRLLNYAKGMNLCTVPNLNIKMPEVNNIQPECLTETELGRLHDVLDGYHDQDVADVLRLALYSGMRRGEILGLAWASVDFERGFITIRNPKGGIDQVIPMSAPARELLDCRRGTASSTWVFPGRGGVGHREEIKRHLTIIRKEAELPEGFRMLHGLRHTFASMLASSGEIDLYTLQRLLTHKSPAMTMRYAHLRDEALRRGAELGGELMSRKASKGQGGKVVEIRKARG